VGADGAGAAWYVGIFKELPHLGQNVIVSSTLLPHFGQYDIESSPFLFSSIKRLSI
jgi:hypothetical protein